MTIRTRFAPSPTGYLHIGGARTALFSWLYARRHGGQFILRIEDTDLERSTPESVQAILDGMSWLGLDCDEGPFFQTRRMARYREVIAQLIDRGQAYRCYCSKERLERLREAQLAAREKPRYDRHCLHHAPQEPAAAHVVRFRNPDSGAVVVDDLIRGRVTFQNSELDDLIIARSDGSPTYNFCVVVDDLDMRITHVIRGDDHLNNTPRQVNILRALAAATPAYAHVPMILGEDGARLSKRHGAASVLNYRDDGYLPEALLNYLLRLGFSHGDQEIFTREEMIALFDLGAVSSAAAAINPGKLSWLNQHWMKTLPEQQVAQGLHSQLQRRGIDAADGVDLAAIVRAQRERTHTLAEMAELSLYFFRDPVDYPVEGLRKHFAAEARPALRSLLEALAALADWSAPAIHAVLQEISERAGLKLGKLAQPLRFALTGSTVSPPIDITAALIGKVAVLRRLQAALSEAESNEVGVEAGQG